MFNAQNALYSDKNTFCIKNTEVFYWVIVGSVLFQSLRNLTLQFVS